MIYAQLVLTRPRKKRPKRTRVCLTSGAPDWAAFLELLRKPRGTAEPGRERIL